MGKHGCCSLKSKGENVKIKNIVFDFDGVIVDTLDFCILEIQQVADSYGYTIPSRIELINGWGMIFQDYLAKFFSGLSLENYLHRRAELGLDKKLPPLIDGSREIVELLSLSHTLAIISNREKGTLHEIIAGSGLKNESFFFIQSCSDTEYHKPDHRVFENYFAKFGGKGIEKSSIVYIGDLVADYTAAKNAGLNFIGVLSGGITSLDEFIQAGLEPDNILTSVKDLPEYLERYNGNNAVKNNLTNRRSML
jgi:phosphoglycolate phosphatase-like HAD superfamily hydrolase